MVNNNRLEPAGAKAAMLKFSDFTVQTVKCLCFCLARPVIRKVIVIIRLLLYMTVLAQGKSLTAVIYNGEMTLKHMRRHAGGTVKFLFPCLDQAIFESLSSNKD